MGGMKHSGRSAENPLKNGKSSFPAFGTSNRASCVDDPGLAKCLPRHFGERKMWFSFCYLVISRVSLGHSFICSFIHGTQRPARCQAATEDLDWDFLGPSEGDTPTRGPGSPGGRSTVFCASSRVQPSVNFLLCVPHYRNHGKKIENSHF